jgi:hypothetical protein
MADEHHAHAGHGAGQQVAHGAAHVLIVATVVIAAAGARHDDR